MKDPATASQLQQQSGQVVSSIQEVYEKAGFRAFVGCSDFEEKWESPTVLLLTGTMEMENENGLTLKGSFSCPITFSEYALDLGSVKPTGLAA